MDNEQGNMCVLNLEKKEKKICNISVSEVRRDDVMTRGKGVKMGVVCVVVVDLLIGERHI